MLSFFGFDVSLVPFIVEITCCECPAKRRIPGWAKVPRRWRCNRCKVRRSMAKRLARAERRKRIDGRDVPYPKTNWVKTRVTAKADCCRICGKAYREPSCVPGEKPKVVLREHIHHIFPARLAAKHGDPNAKVNRLSCCAGCHGTLKRVDNLIFLNDWIGAIAAAKIAHLPLELLDAAAAHYGFNIRRTL